MNSKAASLEEYRKERADRTSIWRFFRRRRSMAPQPQTALSQRTFARLLLVHCANLKVR